MERASLRATFRLRCAERIAPSEVSKDCREDGWMGCFGLTISMRFGG